MEVWLDEYELGVGDRLTESINAGLASSRFGVVVLSRAFFAKRWPKEELEGLAAKEAATGSKVILPVWHGIDQQYLADVAPTLAGRLGVSTTKGIPRVAQELVRASPASGKRQSTRKAASPSSVRSRRATGPARPLKGRLVGGRDAMGSSARVRLGPHVAHQIHRYVRRDGRGAG